MDAVYAAVPASLVGREQEIEIGPMSGKSNVVFWLESRGLPVTDEVVDRIFAADIGRAPAIILPGIGAFGEPPDAVPVKRVSVP